MSNLETNILARHILLKLMEAHLFYSFYTRTIKTLLKLRPLRHITGRAQGTGEVAEET